MVNDEIRFGDNDTLAALVANLVEAEVVAILTDREGLYSSNPEHNSDAELIKHGRADDPDLLHNTGPAGAFGRGGMLTKVQAAHKAARSGAATVIADGRDADTLLRMRAGEPLGTLLVPGTGRMAARKQWLAGNCAATAKWCWTTARRGCCGNPAGVCCPSASPKSGRVSARRHHHLRYP